MHRAYALFEVKAIDDAQHTIEGIASTPSPDRVGDVLEPKGASFALPLPLLWQHQRDLPIGRVVSATVTKAGIAIRAKIEHGILPEIDRAWALIKSGLVRGLSVGFRPLQDGMEPISPKDPFGPMKFTKWEWVELSAVTIPANQDASIQVVKSLCAPLGASPSPAVVGHRQTRRGEMPPISEQISTLQRDLQTKSARFQELLDLQLADGTLDADQTTEFEGLKGSVKTLAERVENLKTLELAQVGMAKGLTYQPSTGDVRLHIPSVSNPQGPKLEPGQAFARSVICQIRSAQDRHGSPYDLARKHYPDHDALHLWLKEDVPAASSVDTTWAGSLVYPTNLASEFVDWLRPQTIIGRLPTTRIPFHVRINKQTSAGAGSWVGEGRAKPLTWWGFSPVTFGEYKVANIAVLTQELARFSSPSAEVLLRNELAAACLERLDRDFVDPNKAVSTGVSPASITNGIVNQDSTGTALTNVRQDATKLLNQFADANISPTHWIMNVRNAIALSLMSTTQGTPAFPEMSATGGTFAGLPVIVSNYCTHGTPLNNFVVLVSAPNIWVADDGGFTIDASSQVSLEMNDAPTMTAGPLGSPTGASGSVVVSMWQTNSVAVKCERFINWARKRTEAVAWMDDVNWTAS